MPESFILDLKLLHPALIQEHLIQHLHLLVPNDLDICGQLQVLPLEVLHLELHRGKLLVLQGQL